VHLDPGSSARLVLLFQGPLVASLAGKIETLLPAIAAAITVFGRESLDAQHGLLAQLVAPNGAGFADPIDQVAKMAVDLLLNEGGGPAGAAISNLTALDQDDVNSRLGKAVGYQRAGYAAADHGHVAASIALEAGMGRQQAVLDDPEGGAGGEIHSLS
jgi:hypothetical protein